MNKLPWIKFWPADWLSDEALRLVSVGARGLWIDMLCLMAKSERPGYLQVNGGVNPTLDQVARLVALPEAQLEPLITELMKAGVCSVEHGTGIVYSRRMVRDRAEYERASEFGKRGGNPIIMRVKGRVKAPVKLTRQPPLASSVLPLASKSGSDSEAEAIYSAYPRKQGKADALKAIRAALGVKTADQLLEATEAYAKATSEWPADRLRFIPHPSTWFNRARYDDDRATWKFIPESTVVRWQRPATTAEEHAKGF